MGSRLRPWLLRIWRLLALALAAWLLHVAAQKAEVHSRKTSISLEQARRFFPRTVQVSPAGQETGSDGAFDESGKLLGYLITTSPQADDVIGYVGPNNLLVALDPKGRVTGAELISSGDTVAHVSTVTNATAFWKQLIGWRPAQEPMPKIEAVAGSTLTSLGIAESLQKRLAGHVDSLRFPEPVKLVEVQGLFTNAQTFQMDDARPGWHIVKDQAGTILGFAVRTSPYSDYTHGHAGPTESLLAVSPDSRTLLGLKIRRSYDTDDYVDSVREDADYLRQLTSFTVEQWAKMDLKKAGLEGVSGATETSFAVAEGIQHRFAADAARSLAPAQRSFLKPRDWALFAVLAGSLVMTFSPWRGRPKIRLVWQAILIGIFGLWCGDLLSLALLAGWARHGVAWSTALSLSLLVVIALLIPWATRRQIYCHQLCPHGAAQEWLGRFKKWHVTLPSTVVKYLRFGPGVVLTIAFLLGLARPHFDLASLEPFDAWALRGAVVAATVIALLSLGISLFVPMGFCRFACPTGALLKFVRTTGSNEHWSLRDSAASLLLAVGISFTFWPAPHTGAITPEATTELHGTCFGTTWNVKLRHTPSDTAALQQRIAAELESVENTLSHWRPTSATSRFNAAGTTQPMEMPEELVTLVARALEISRASEGAYDITVAPLVQAWGFGPHGVPPTAPTEEEVTRLRTFTGWEKLTVNTNTHTLQKAHPDLQIDLGSILQGYGADCVAKILNAANQTNYLIDVGGEFLARGTWRVGIENPAQPDQSLRVLNLENAALATSGTYRAKHTDGKKHWSHLIDPKTGDPVEHHTTLVSIIHPSCASADAWATALIVSGNQRAEGYAKANHISALIVTDGHIAERDFPQDRH